MSSTANQRQSRFGFHPCDRELFFKVKYLHKRYWETLRAFHQWHRWNNKDPQNRVGVKPVYCPALVVDRLWRKPITRRGEQHYKWYPKTVVEHDVVLRYQTARTPSAEPVEAWSADEVQAIQALYENVKEYFPD